MKPVLKEAFKCGHFWILENYEKKSDKTAGTINHAFAGKYLCPLL